MVYIFLCNLFFILCVFEIHFLISLNFLFKSRGGLFFVVLFFFLTSISIAPVPRSPMLCITLGCSILSRRPPCNSGTPDTLFQSETCIAQKNDMCSLFCSVVVLQLRNSPGFQLFKRISFLLSHFLSLCLHIYMYVYIYVYEYVYSGTCIYLHIFICVLYIWRQRYKYICVYIYR